MASIGDMFFALIATPEMRAAVLGTLTLGLLYFIKPAFAFSSDGSARPFIFFDKGNQNATAFPVWLDVLGAALFGYLFL